MKRRCVHVAVAVMLAASIASLDAQARQSGLYLTWGGSIRPLGTAAAAARGFRRPVGPASPASRRHRLRLLSPEEGERRSRRSSLSPATDCPNSFGPEGRPPSPLRR